MSKRKLNQITIWVSKKESLAFAIAPFVKYGKRFEIVKQVLMSEKSAQYALFG